MDSASRYSGADANVKISMTDPRRAACVNYGLTDTRALFVGELVLAFHLAGGIALQATRNPPLLGGPAFVGPIASILRPLARS